MFGRQLAQPRAQLFVALRSGPVAATGAIQLQQPTGAPFAHLISFDEQPRVVASRYRPQPFFSITAFSATLSRLRSATSVFSRRFSSSTSLSRFNSLTSSPAYFDFHAKMLAVDTPYSRPTSLTFRPASHCFGISMIFPGFAVGLVPKS
jgi:hypothetical protein